MIRAQTMLRGAARLAPTMGLAPLVLVGVFRPQLPEWIAARWVGVVLALGFLSSSFYSAYVFDAARGRSLRSIDPFRYALLAVFPLVLAALYLQPQRVASDGVHYFATLRSVVVDGDLNFENEYRALGAGEAYFQPTATGHLPNTFSVGPALIWAPAYLLIHGLGHLGLFRPTGFGYPYFTAIATVTAVCGLLGVLWLYALVRRYCEPSVALAATLLIWLGTFHVWYMVFEPSMPHAFGMASVTGYLLLCHREPRRNRDYVLLGLAAGSVMLVRWQNVLFLPVGWAILGSTQARPKWSQAAIFSATAIALFLPQMIFWKIIYGRFFLVPQGTSYMAWHSPQLEAVLFSSRHGLLSWSPVLWLGLIGLFVLARKAPVLAVSLVGALAAATYVNASVHDWWAGASFGARRFDGTLAAFGLGLGVLIEWLVPRVKQNALVFASLALAPFVFWNVSLMELYSRGTIPFDGPVSFGQALQDAVELVYRRTGYPFSWPAAWRLRYREGAPLATYDLAGARYVSNNVFIRMGDTDALYLGTGWSLPEREAQVTVRQIASGGGTVYVAFRESAPYRLLIEGRSSGPVAVLFQERDLGTADLGATGGTVEIAIPRDVVVAGLNRLVLVPAAAQRTFISRLSFVRQGPMD
jgi:hypothetical protein